MIYFLLYLLAEVLVSVNLSSQIGGLNTFFELIGSAVLGVAILANFRNTLLENLHSVSLKKIDLQEFQRLNLFTVIGAILLIIPGFLTDIIGVLLQFSVITTMFVNKFSSPVSRDEFQENNFKQEKESIDEIIDVEIISERSIK